MSTATSRRMLHGGNRNVTMSWATTRTLRWTPCPTGSCTRRCCGSTFSANASCSRTPSLASHNERRMELFSNKPSQAPASFPKCFIQMDDAPSAKRMEKLTLRNMQTRCYQYIHVAQLLMGSFLFEKNVRFNVSM